VDDALDVGSSCSIEDGDIAIAIHTAAGGAPSRNGLCRVRSCAFRRPETPPGQARGRDRAAAGARRPGGLGRCWGRAASAVDYESVGASDAAESKPPPATCTHVLMGRLPNCAMDAGPSRTPASEWAPGVVTSMRFASAACPGGPWICHGARRSMGRPGAKPLGAH